MRKKKVFITGANGFIGSRFIQRKSDEFNIISFRKNKKNRSITRINDVENAFVECNPDVVLHLAAKAHIDKCQKDKKDGLKSETWNINVNGTKNLVKVCEKYNRFLLYLSTECVFDGKKGWFEENDRPNPINWYGETKLAAEKQINNCSTKFCILRSVMAYGHPIYYPHDLFFVFYKLLVSGKEVRAVADQQLNLTYIDDLVDVISYLLKNEIEGLYHFGGVQSLTPFEFAQKIKYFFSLKGSVTSVSLVSYFKNKAKLRLKKATLSTKKIEKNFGIRASDVNRALRLIKRNLIK